jgi:hypothetical protein
MVMEVAVLILWKPAVAAAAVVTPGAEWAGERRGRARDRWGRGRAGEGIGGFRDTTMIAHGHPRSYEGKP